MIYSIKKHLTSLKVVRKTISYELIKTIIVIIIIGLSQNSSQIKGFSIFIFFCIINVQFDDLHHHSAPYLGLKAFLSKGERHCLNKYLHISLSK